MAIRYRRIFSRLGKAQINLALLSLLQDFMLKHPKCRRHANHFNPLIQRAARCGYTFSQDYRKCCENTEYKYIARSRAKHLIKLTSVQPAHGAVCDNVQCQINKQEG